MKNKTIRWITVSILTTLSLMQQITALAAEPSTTTISAARHWILWQGTPLTITLPLSKPKSLVFNNAVEIGVPPTLTDKLVIKNDAGNVTFTAIKPINNQRIEIKDTVTGKLIILNLDTSQQSTSLPIYIRYTKPNTQAATSGWSGNKPSALQGQMSYITLTRFAEQQLYAPKRLLKNPYGFQLVNSFVNQNQNVPQSEWTYNLFIDHSVVGMPWAEWYGNGLYVTAIIIKNKLPISINLRSNLTNICGRDSGLWKTVTFFPSWQLSPSGKSNDSTVGFFITSKPYADVIKLCKAV